MELSITQLDLQRYTRALRLATEHDSKGKFHMVASAYKGSRHIGDGYNAYPIRRAGETYSKEYSGMGTHAELELCSRYRLRRSTIYIAGINSNRNAIVSCPCPRCNNLILNTEAKFLVFNSNEGLVKIAVKDLKIMKVPAYNERAQKQRIST